MMEIHQLSVDISKYGERVIDNLINAQIDTAEQIYADVVENAPYKTGGYVESIKIGETEYDGEVMSTTIYTDATVTSKAGDEYNLGELLEYGTSPHAIPNAFGRGYTYGYTDSNGRYHKGTMDKNWHEGSRAFPHFTTALQKNIALYEDNIGKALKEAE